MTINLLTLFSFGLHNSIPSWETCRKVVACPLDEREKRAAAILVLLNLCERDGSSARCLTPKPHGGSGNQRNWVIDVTWQIAHCGKYARTLMELDLIDQSQIRPRYALEFLQRQGEEQTIRLMSPITRQALYALAVETLIHRMQIFSIPDSYIEEAA